MTTKVDKTMDTTSGQLRTAANSGPDNATNLTADREPLAPNEQQRATITDKQQDVLNRLDLSPATLEALKTLSAISASEGIEKLSTCDKLTASLEQIRAKKNMKLFEKLSKIKQDFSELNHKITKMEESIHDLRRSICVKDLSISTSPSMHSHAPDKSSHGGHDTNRDGGS